MFKKIIYLTLLILIFSSCKSNSSKDEYTNKVNTTKNDFQDEKNQEDKNTNDDLEDNYEIPIDLPVNSEPKLNSGQNPVFNIKKDYKVKTIEENSDYVKISFEEKIGWIPKWYLSISPKEISIKESYALVSSKPGKYFLYPNSEQPMYNDVNNDYFEGKFFKVIAEYKEWVCVKFITYDCPWYDLHWIKKDTTTNYDEKIVQEGFLDKETISYTDTGKLSDISIQGFVFIIESKDDLYHVISPGGMDTFIKKTDFKPVTLDDLIDYEITDISPVG